MQDFLKSEVRNEYLVTEKQKHIWKIELDIMQEIIRICDKYGIPYIVYGGTLLGAVRHNGFIPWDDDMDLAMLRKDYEIFLQKAKEELDPKIFCLQESETVGEIYEGFARIRYNNSTAMIERDRKKNCNHGIFIDIFPLDQISPNAIARKLQFGKIKLLTGLLYYHTYQDCGLRSKLGTLAVALIKKPKTWERIAKSAKKTCMKYNDRKCEKVGILSCDPYDEKCYWYREDIENTIEMDYEYLKVSAPKNYDRCLKIGYGDYMAFPPVEERGKWHENIFFDPYQPFTEYTQQKDKGAMC